MIKNSFLKDRIFVRNCILALAFTVFIFAAFRWMPIAYMHLIVEDSYGEYFTFAGYLVSSLLLLSALIINRDLRKPLYFLLTACFFIMAMEEISWGQRIMNFNTPENMLFINSQNEFNFHNLFFVHVKPAYVFVVTFWALILPFLVKRFRAIRNITDKFAVPVLSLEYIPLFALSLFFFIFEVVPKSDEINEMLFAFAFLSFSNSIFIESLKKRKPGGKSLLLYSCAGLIVSLIFTVFLSINFPDYNSQKTYMLDFASRHYPKHGMMENSGKIFSLLLNNPHLKDDNVLLQYGIFLDKKGCKEKSAEILNSVLLSQQNKIDADINDPGPNITRGDIYYHLKNYEKFQSEYSIGIKKIIAHLEKEKNHIKRIETLSCLTFLYGRLDDYRSSFFCFKQAYSLCNTKLEKGRLEERGNLILRRLINN
jgi:hypothetical protein